METKRVKIYSVRGWIDGVEREYPDGRLEYADLRGNVIPDAEILEVR